MCTYSALWYTATFYCTSREGECNFCQQLVFVLLFLSQSCCIHHCYQHSLTVLLSAHSLIWQLGDCYRFPFYPVLFLPLGVFLLIIMIFSATLEGSIVTARKKNAQGLPWWCLKRGEQKGNKTGKKMQNCQSFPWICLSTFYMRMYLISTKHWTFTLSNFNS